jgi:hypothetical protein
MMAERAGARRVLPLVLVGLGVFLLVLAIMLPTYAKGKLAITPLKSESTTVSDGPNATVLVPSSLADDVPGAQVDEGVNLLNQRYVSVEDPSNDKLMTWQAGFSTLRTDKSDETGLLEASVDRVTVDRKTQVPVDDPVATFQSLEGAPPIELPRTGFQYKFPFNLDPNEQHYYFDLNSRTEVPMVFMEQTELAGLKVDHYQQIIPVTDLAAAQPEQENHKLTMPAEMWGVPGGDVPITMKRYYENVRDLWIEPVTGNIIKGAEQMHQFYSRNGQAAEIEIIKVTFTFTDDSIANQAAMSKAGLDQLNLIGRTLPIGLGILGLISLGAGLFLGLRKGKSGGDDETGSAEPFPSDDDDNDAQLAFAHSRHAAPDDSATQQIPRVDTSNDETTVIPKVNWKK